MGRVNQRLNSFSGPNPNGGPQLHPLPCLSHLFLGTWASQDDRDDDGRAKLGFHTWPQLGLV